MNTYSAAKTCLSWRIAVRSCFRRNLSSQSTANEKQGGGGECDSYDIIIAGGGMVGTAMACSLARSSFLSEKRILLLEAGKPRILKSVQQEFSNRVSTINPSSIELFKKLEVWDDIRSMRAQPVKKMHIWEACSESFITYENEQMREEVAFVIENDVIVSSLLKKLDSGIEIANNCRVKELVLPKSDEGDAVALTLEDGKTLRCDLLIGADGLNSLVRKTMGVNYIHWSYGQEALVATLELSESTHNNVAWQRFLPTGPIALLPLDDNHSSLVWTNTPSNIKNLLSLSEEEFVDALNAALWKDNEKIPWIDTILTSARDALKSIVPNNAVRQLPPSVESVAADSRAAFPLSLGHASNYVGPAVALVGDAAHRVHPLAGLGVNLGFRDVATLTEVIETAVYEGSEIGRLTHLRDYERRSQSHVVPTMMAIEGLHRLYTTSFPPLVLLRGLGLQLTNSCEPLKQRIITHASS